MLIARITDADFEGGEPIYLQSVNRYGARGILLDEEGRIAMMYMAQNGCYKLPGGGIEKGEAIEAAFLREVKEETGYDAILLHEIGIIEEHKSKNHFLQQSYCFIARRLGNQSKQHLTQNELSLGFELVWMEREKAIVHMAESLDICTDYKMRFMLLRDKTLLESAAPWI